LGIGDWGLGPIPNPQSPIPNPQSPIPNKKFYNFDLKQINILLKNCFFEKYILNLFNFVFIKKKK
jgi:hypothetical protein